ncbi:MAG TPA: SUMF1/EgtB/PvdO family nonheme iron enzyme [Acidobacteriota bacterium]
MFKCLSSTMLFALSVMFCCNALADCPSGMVQSGSICVDQYEASLWKITEERCIKQLKKGKAINLRACGAVQLGVSGTDYVDAQCQFNGAGCKNIFALSIPGVIPAHTINYFIAAAACRNSNKRMITNSEWQTAALGTPDPWPQDDPANQCNLETPAVTLTGSRSACVSDVEAYDMVGNVIEFVADWGPLATSGTNWDVFVPGFGGDVSNMGGAPNGPIYGMPGTTLRGGSFAIVPNSGGTGERAGVYAIDQNGAPNSIGDGSSAGFRCAK